MNGLRERVGCLMTLAIALVAAHCAGFEAGRALAEDPSADVVVLRHCAVDYERITAIGAPIYSVLQDCLVAPGDQVEAGQLLGRLQDDDVRAELRIRELEATSDVEIRLGAAKEAEARNKLARTATLLRRNAASQEEYNLHRLEAESALLVIEQARHRHELALVQLRNAQTQVRARALVSPHEGIVVALLKHRGEPIGANEVIFRIVDPRLLNIVGQVDVVELGRLRVGLPVRVVPEVAGAELALEREVFKGRLAFIDTHIDPLTRTCKVIARVENRGGLLRAGVETRMEIDPSAPVVAGSVDSIPPVPPPLSGKPPAGASGGRH
jgi:RND family efflux transporter MFP subunit